MRSKSSARIFAQKSEGINTTSCWVWIALWCRLDLRTGWLAWCDASYWIYLKIGRILMLVKLQTEQNSPAEARHMPATPPGRWSRCFTLSCAQRFAVGAARAFLVSDWVEIWSKVVVSSRSIPQRSSFLGMQTVPEVLFACVIRRPSHL